MSTKRLVGAIFYHEEGPRRPCHQRTRNNDAWNDPARLPESGPSNTAITVDPKHTVSGRANNSQIDGLMITGGDLICGGCSSA